MANKVGTKGQVVIDKAIRDELGIEPGWRALQLLVDDHVEIRFIPPDHNRSLAGILAPHIKRRAAEDDVDLRQAREEAWKLHVLDEWGPGGNESSATDEDE